MKMFRKQTARAPLITVLLVLLLALSIAASSIGFAAWTGASKQFEEIDGQYTTIAIPSGLNQEKLYEAGSYRSIGFDSKEFEDGSRYYGPFDSENTARKSPNYLGADHRVLLSAHIQGAKPLSSGTIDPLSYNFVLDQYCYQLSVMALRCIDVKETFYDWRDYRTCSAEFEIIADVCRIAAYDLPPYDDTLRIETKIFTREGEIPFEVGKTYLVRGRYWDYDVTRSYEWSIDENGEEQVKSGLTRDPEGSFKSRSMLINPEYPLMSSPDTIGVATGLKNWILELKKYPDSDQKYWCVPEKDCWPYYTEYTGDYIDFLNSEEGLVWKNEIIPYFETNHSSVPVILTDNVASMYYFNSGDATLLEGSFFTDDDYKAGNSVCLVSASYAQVNDLSVGDTINLDYYETGYEQSDYVIIQGSGRNGLTVVRYPLSENTRMDVQKEYTIIGIYSAPEWQAGTHSFHADTIFVPKASVPDADKYAGTSLNMLNTVIIENGSIDAFEAHMAANDKAGAYLYFDQGYTEAAATVQTLIDNAMRLMMVGIAMFMLASMLFLLLFARRVSAVMRSMRLLGVPKKGVWLESLGMLVMQEMIAVILGNGLAVILYDRITAQLLSGTPALDITSIALCAGAQLAVLVAVGGVWMHRIAGSNLMQKSEGGKLLWNKNKAASCGA